MHAVNIISHGKVMINQKRDTQAQRSELRTRPAPHVTDAQLLRPAATDTQLLRPAATDTQLARTYVADNQTSRPPCSDTVTVHTSTPGGHTARGHDSHMVHTSGLDSNMVRTSDFQMAHSSIQDTQATVRTTGTDYLSTRVPAHDSHMARTPAPDTLMVPEPTQTLPRQESRRESIDSGRGPISYDRQRRDSMETYQRRQASLSRQATLTRQATSSSFGYNSGSNALSYGTIPRISSCDYDDPYGREEEIFSGYQHQHRADRSYSTINRGYSEDYDDAYDEDMYDYNPASHQHLNHRPADQVVYDRWGRRRRVSRPTSRQSEYEGSPPDRDYQETGSRMGSARSSIRHGSDARGYRSEPKQVRFKQQTQQVPIYQESRGRDLGDLDSSFSGSDEGVEQLYIAPRLSKPEVSDGIQYQFGPPEPSDNNHRPARSRRQQEYFDGFASDNSNYDNSREPSDEDEVRVHTHIRYQQPMSRVIPKVMTSDFSEDQVDYVPHEPYGEVSMYGHEPDLVPPVPAMESGTMLERYLQSYGVGVEPENSAAVQSSRSKPVVMSRPPRPPAKKTISRGTQ